MTNATNTIHIFKRGRHVASNGTAIDFTDAMLSASAAAYDTARHEAPLVIGHPKHDDPAYGWVKSLRYADGEMAIEPDQVDPQFAELHSAGRFKKRSASFYAPDAPNNPVPGVYYLRHVGFLGAQAPAIKGLKAANFSDAEQGVIEFSDWGDRVNASMWRRFRDWLIGEKGLEVADQVVPDYQVQQLEEEARTDKTPSMAYSEPNNQEQDMLTEAQKKELADREAKLKADQAALDTRAAEFAEREKTIKDAEAAAARAAVVEFVGTLVKAGKVLPRDQAGLVAYMAGPNEAGVIEFAESDDPNKKTSKPAADWLRGFLDGLPKQVDYTERSGGTVVEQENDAQAIANKALEFQDAEAKAGRTVSITAAVTHVTAASK